MVLQHTRSNTMQQQQHASEQTGYSLYGCLLEHPSGVQGGWAHRTAPAIGPDNAQQDHPMQVPRSANWPQGTTQR
jgi:hypothetical protein